MEALKIIPHLKVIVESQDSIVYAVLNNWQVEILNLLEMINLTNFAVKMFTRMVVLVHIIVITIVGRGTITTKTLNFKKIGVLIIVNEIMRHHLTIQIHL